MGNRPALCQIMKIISFYELNANHDLGFRIANACKENPRYAMHSERTYVSATYRIFHGMLVIRLHLLNMIVARTGPGLE